MHEAQTAPMPGRATTPGGGVVLHRQVTQTERGAPPDIVLSLFPGLGFLCAAFEAEGFCVVRGPDLLWGGDVRAFSPPPGAFDGVIGGPPCQAFSRLRHIVHANGHKTKPNLIPEFERIVAEAAPRWFVMENVPDAPEPVVDGYSIASVLVRHCDVGGLTTRPRRFSYGVLGGTAAPLRVQFEALVPVERHRAVTCDGREVPVKCGPGGVPKGRQRDDVDGGRLPGNSRTIPVPEMLRRQGFAPDLLKDCPLTVTGKRRAVGNAVPRELGVAIARAVKHALSESV